jgi:hypothetical protein
MISKSVSKLGEIEVEKMKKNYNAPVQKRAGAV